MQQFTTHVVERPEAAVAYRVSLPLSGDRRGILVVIHGHSRSPALAEAFADTAAREGVVLLVPFFDIEEFDDFQILRGTAGPRAAADALNAVCEDVGRRFDLAPRPIALVGFSGGAQFAHRYAMCFPQRVAALVSASAGWYTMPDAYVGFPYGLAASADMPEGIQYLDDFLRLPVRVMVGENDSRRDGSLRASALIDETQGQNRLERANAWVQAIRTVASCRGLAPAISIEILPGSGHSVDQAIRKGGLVWRSVSFLRSQWGPETHDESVEASD
jgi:pimeloyl-ACP methyl ester carboxylesterase